MNDAQTQEARDMAEAAKLNTFLSEHLLDKAYTPNVAAAVLMAHAINACVSCGLDGPQMLRLMAQSRRELLDLHGAGISLHQLN